MATVNGIETEWTILQRKHGNLPKKPKKKKEVIPEKNKLEDYLKMGVNELTEELEGNQNTETEDNILMNLRKLRLQKLKEQKALNKYSGVKTIQSNEYIKEVSEGSKNPDGTGVHVICHLFSPGKAECKLIDDILLKLSYKHKYAKFIRIQGNIAIQNFPEQNCPTVIIYYGGTMTAQITGLSKFGGPNKTTVNSVEWELSQLKILRTDLTKDPNKKMKENKTNISFVQKGKVAKGFNQSDSEDEDEDDGDGNNYYGKSKIDNDYDDNEDDEDDYKERDNFEYYDMGLGFRM